MMFGDINHGSHSPSPSCSPRRPGRAAFLDDLHRQGIGVSFAAVARQLWLRDRKNGVLGPTRPRPPLERPIWPATASRTSTAGSTLSTWVVRCWSGPTMPSACGAAGVGCVVCLAAAASSSSSRFSQGARGTVAAAVSPVHLSQPPTELKSPARYRPRHERAIAAVLTGPKRTATDNVEAVLTGTLRCLRR
jgi:hypothetical protein